MPGFIKCKVINHAQLRKANRYAIDNKFKRYLEDINDLKNIPEDTVFPIHYSVKRQPKCYRVLFEYFNGELYQLDMEDSIYNALEEKEIAFITQ